MDEDVYEEISVTDNDYEERMKLMRALDQRDRDHRALELESVLEELKKNVKDNDDFETMTNVSMQEMKDLKEDNKK